MGDDHFEAKGGEDSLLANAELTVGAVSSILRDFDLKKVETLHVEEALALSLQGTVSVCLSAFFYSSCRCVNCDAPIPGCLVDNPSTCGISASHIMRPIHE